MNTTITKEKVAQLTRKGFKELKKAISSLETDRKKMLQELHEIDKSFAREERLLRSEKLADLDTVEAKLEEKRHILSSAKILPSKRKHIRVAIGSVVDLIDRQGQRFRYKIVESAEANPSDGRISDRSPIGRSLLGKTVRDFIEWSNGKSVVSLTIAQVC